MQERSCPICRNDEQEVLLTRVFPGDDHFQVVQCKSCKMIFNSKGTRRTSVNYEITEKYIPVEMFGVGSIWALSSTKSQISLLVQYLDTDSKILDFGFGSGALLQNLYKLGYTMLYGIEASAPAREAFKQHSQSHNIVCYENFNEVPREEKFDLIVMSHVLEHLSNPEEVIREGLNHLSENGLLYVEVPDAARYSEYRVLPFHFFDHEHINHFTDIDLLQLLRGMTQTTFVLHGTVDVTDSNSYPVLRYLGRLQKMPPLDEYIEWSRQMSTQEIPEGFDKQAPFYIYGWGSYAKSLVVRYDLLTAGGFQGIIDSFVVNRRVEQLRDERERAIEVQIYPPNVLSESPGVQILIASALFSDVIESSLRKSNYDVVIHRAMA